VFNHVELFRAVARKLPSADCIVFRDRRVTFEDLSRRVNQVGNLLVNLGARTPTPRSELQGWESGQSHVGLMLRNGPEYIEAMLGSMAARAVSYNINYRYVDRELAYLLQDAGTEFLIYHAEFAPVVQAALELCEIRPRLVQVADGSDQPLLLGALDYEEALEVSSPGEVPVAPAVDDLYLLYTGGTTGMPKGTLWTQGDIYANVFSSALPEGTAPSTVEQAADIFVEQPRYKFMSLPPFMHAAGQWTALNALFTGAATVIPDNVETLDTKDVWTVAEREQIALLILVGDAFARPLCDELEANQYSIPSLEFLLNGGAVLGAASKRRLLKHFPRATLVDGAGSTESGTQLNQIHAPGAAADFEVFLPNLGTVVLSEDKTCLLEPGHEGLGWLGRTEPIPLGYLGDPEKTASTFVVVDGRRVSVPGDRVRLRQDGTIELLGRESSSINSGGEKIFVEEVEQAVKTDPRVLDALVVGRPSDRWGSEVVAVVQLAAGVEMSDDELRAGTAGVLARYKLPKAFIRVAEVKRSASGKPDYRWAQELASAPGTSPREEGSP